MHTRSRKNNDVAEAFVNGRHNKGVSSPSYTAARRSTAGDFEGAAQILYGLKSRGLFRRDIKGS
jgi:hypothetical protein